MGVDEPGERRVVEADEEVGKAHDGRQQGDHTRVAEAEPGGMEAV